LSDPVVATFTFTRDEYVRAMKRHYKTALNVRRDVIAGIAGITGGLYLALESSLGWVAWLLFTAGAILLALVAYAMFLLPRMIYNSQPKLKNQYRLAFSDDGIGFKTDGIDSTLQWSIYQSWLSDNEFYIMYHGKRDLSVIPRRALIVGAADSRLREMLEHNVGPALSTARAPNRGRTEQA
jgi:hypothetical protein